MASKRPCPLPTLLEANRNAMTVYGAIRWLAGDKGRLSTTRKRIKDVCGLSERTIGDAVAALDSAGWITLNYGCDGSRKWYRLSLPMVGFLPMCGKTARRKRLSVSKNSTKETVSYGTKNSTLPLTGNSRQGSATATPALPRMDEDERLKEITAKIQAGEIDIQDCPF